MKEHSFRIKAHQFKRSFIYTAGDKADSAFQFVGNLNDYLKRLHKSYKMHLRYNKREHIHKNIHTLILKDYIDTVVYLSVRKDTLDIDFREDYFEKRNTYYNVSGYGNSFSYDEQKFLHRSLISKHLVLLHNHKPYIGKIIWRRECTSSHYYRWWGKRYYMGTLDEYFFSYTKNSVHIH